MAEVASVYRSCDVLVKLSYVEGMFGPPLEIFHCGGTAIVYDVNGYEEYMRDGLNSLIVPTGSEQGVMNAISLLKTSPDTLARLKKGALSTAADWIDWDNSSMQFMQCIEKSLTMPSISLNDLDLFFVAIQKKITPVPTSNNISTMQKIQRGIKTFIPSRVKKLIKPWVMAYVTSHKKGYGARTKTCSFSKEEIIQLQGLNKK
jgi:hypothetical protein